MGLIDCTEIQFHEVYKTLGASLMILLKPCVGLKKLVLTECSGLQSKDVDDIAVYGLQLQQLVLSGVIAIDADNCGM